MMNDPDLIRRIIPGSIVQIVPEEDHGLRTRLLVVTRVNSWGVDGTVEGHPGSVSRTWNLIEPTGGQLVFDADGKRVGPTPQAQRHHP